MSDMMHTDNMIHTDNTAYTDSPVYADSPAPGSGAAGVSGSANRAEAVHMNEKQAAMRKNFPLFGVTAILFGLFFNLCFYKNLEGSVMSFLFALGTSALFFLWIKKLGLSYKKRGLFYLAAYVLLGFSSFFTGDYRIQALNVCAMAVLAVVFMTCQCNEDCSWGFLKYIMSVFYEFLDTVLCVGRPFQDLKNYMREKGGGNHKRIRGILMGVVIAAPLMTLAIVLLSTADAVFGNMFLWFLNSFVHSLDAVCILIITAALSFLAYGFLSALSNDALLEGKKEKRNGDPTVAVTFLSLLSAVYVVFCVIQIVFLFMKGGTLPQGYTYAQYARRGFFQLLFICVLNLALVLFCLEKFRENKVLKIIMTVVSGCTYVMTASSALRMMLYIGAYRLTFLRVFVLLALLLIAVVLTGIVVNIYKNNFPLFHFALTAVTLGYVLFSLSRPDYFIAKYNYGAGEEDFVFSSYNYSMDAVPAIADIASQDSRLKGEAREYLKRYGGIVEEENVGENGIRSFNLSRRAALRELESCILSGDGLY